MRLIAVASIVAALGCFSPRPVAAQQLLGFSSFDVNADVNGQVFHGVSGGVLLDVAGSWISVGAQGELLISFPYFAGRGGPLAQINVLRCRPFRVFGMGGFAWGEEAGPMIGAGIEIWARRVGLRATVQDYLIHIQGINCGHLAYDQAFCEANFHDGRPYTGHQPSFQVGIIWH